MLSTAINTPAPVEFALPVSVAPRNQKTAENHDRVDECGEVESTCNIEGAHKDGEYVSDDPIDEPQRILVPGKGLVPFAPYVRTRSYAPQLARFLPRDR